MAPLGCEVLAGGCSFQRRVRPCPLVTLPAPRVVGKGTGSLPGGAWPGHSCVAGVSGLKGTVWRGGPH